METQSGELGLTYAEQGGALTITDLLANLSYTDAVAKCSVAISDLTSV